MMNADADVVCYNEYGDIEEDRFITFENDGLTYIYDSGKPNNELIVLDKKIENYNNYYYNRYFEQRPDVKILYMDIDKSLNKKTKDYEYITSLYTVASDYLKHYSTPLLLEKSKSLEIQKEQLENEIKELEIEKNEIISEVYEYNNCLNYLEEINKKIEYYNMISCGLGLTESTEFDTSDYWISGGIPLLSFLKSYGDEYSNLLKQKEEYANKINEYITSAITLDDIKDKLKGYNSSVGTVPAGEWDTWTNPKYEGEGYETGMSGSFEGPQGKETGYDSRKGAEKTNYKDPDRSLLKFLSEVIDSEGNILYPMRSFEKGGEYYYHIFGVNEDGSINWNLVDNPRFGCKMLGNYLIVGADQRLNRERGSKVMTSLGPAIVFDYGTIPDLDADPSHIDISMDEVLFWLKDFSHNQNRQVESLAGIYDWCTPDTYDGVIDEDYEHMERNYVNNLNVKFDTNFTCIFDREDFENETVYDSQEDFVYKLSLYM